MTSGSSNTSNPNTGSSTGNESNIKLRIVRFLVAKLSKELELTPGATLELLVSIIGKLGSCQLDSLSETRDGCTECSRSS